jgi:hypothetical protein
MLASTMYAQLVDLLFQNPQVCLAVCDETIRFTTVHHVCKFFDSFVSSDQRP